MSAPLQVGSTLESAASQAGRRAASYLAGLQARDGHWYSEIKAEDAALEACYILFQLWLYPPVDGKWTPETRPLIDKAVRSILDRQMPGDIDGCVQVYCALKLAGISVDEPRMARLRQQVLDLGGLQAAGAHVKIHLSFFELYPARDCASIPPELMLLPFDVPYEMAAWERTSLAPLSIVQSTHPRRPVPAGFKVDELQASPAGPNHSGSHRLLNFYDRHAPKSIRRRAVEKAKDWMIERLRHADGLGAIYPAMMHSVMALDALGYRADDPLRVAALRQFNSLMVDDGERFFFQPRFSPVWDTALAAYALGQRDSGARALGPAANWLLAREVRRKGDWSRNRPNTAPSGWAFEYSNEFYPSIDVTAMALLALSETHAPDLAADMAADPASMEACEKRGLAWLLSMQSSDGGWAAFNADQGWKFLERLPFAGGKPMLDASCPDITGRVLEALAAQRVSASHAAVRRGMKWLVDHQESDGSWCGHWGVAFIYGTCFALRGLAASGESDREAHILRAGEWVRSIQNADGGWGESAAGYRRGMFVAAPSTPSQTAWAILGLIAGGDANSLSVQHGIEHLLERQREDGSWGEEPATGAGVPRGSYLHHHLYKDYFPLLALSTFVKSRCL